MGALYENGIAPAVTRAGYRVTRVDLQEHNDFIMDQVLGDIRLAPFVIADFTGNRGGVYLEAGFARGLGTPVIHTCSESDFNDAHFDIQQINTIRWVQPEDVLDRLFHRIRGTIGEGPYRRQEA
jgi:nucleoside 2-deoxyribosyltransferase